jgi:Domain of unknown function (DUF3291)/Putative binding domain, N-terminal
MATHHIAQVNIGRIRGPLDGPVMAGFVNRLNEINALADQSPGFVWRLQTAEGNATYFRPYDDDDRIRLSFEINGSAYGSSPFFTPRTVRSQWLNNLSLFFHDLSAAGTQRTGIRSITITPSPEPTSDVPSDMGITACILFDGSNQPYQTRCDTSAANVTYFPWLPYATPYNNQKPVDLKDYDNAPSLLSYSTNSLTDATLAQSNWGWQGWQHDPNNSSCAGSASYHWNGDMVWTIGATPSGCSPFILWFDTVLQAAQFYGLTVEEVDLGNEMDLTSDPEHARLLYDNQTHISVLDKLNDIMVYYGNPANRVTASASVDSLAASPALTSPPTEPVTFATCWSHYGDPAELIRESAIINATQYSTIGIGLIDSNTQTTYLNCEGTGRDYSNLQPIPAPTTQPSINDIHYSPGIAITDLNGWPGGTYANYNESDVQNVAKQVYSDFRYTLARNNLTSNIAMIGETSSNSSKANENDPGYVAGGPKSSAQNALGLMASTLVTSTNGGDHGDPHNLVVRPWESQTDAIIYDVPATLGWPNGPYNPCSFSVSPASANMSSSSGSGQTMPSESGACLYTVSSDSSWLTFSPTNPGGTYNINYYVTANTGASRTGHLIIAGQYVTITQAAGSGGTGTVSGNFYDFNENLLPGGSETLSVDGQPQSNLPNPYSITLPTGTHTVATYLPSGYTLAGYSLQGGAKVNSSSVTFSVGSSGNSLMWYYLPQNVSLSNITLSSPRLYNASSTITAGPSVNILNSAGVTFQSGGQIFLEPGFHAGGTGGNTWTTFYAVIGSSW